MFVVRDDEELDGEIVLEEEDVDVEVVVLVVTSLLVVGATEGEDCLVDVDGAELCLDDVGLDVMPLSRRDGEYDGEPTNCKNPAALPLGTWTSSSIY